MCFSTILHFICIWLYKALSLFLTSTNKLLHYCYFYCKQYFSGKNKYINKNTQGHSLDHLQLITVHLLFQSEDHREPPYGVGFQNPAERIDRIQTEDFPIHRVMR